MPPVQILTRRDVAATWTSDNPVLAAGERGHESDTGFEKVGDGVTAWTALAYSVASPLVASGAQVTAGNNGLIWNGAAWVPAQLAQISDAMALSVALGGGF